MGDAAEQLRQALARIRDALDFAENLAFAVFFPAFQRGLEQGFARAEVPVEAAFGHAQAAGKRLHGKRADALFGDKG